MSDNSNNDSKQQTQQGRDCMVFGFPQRLMKILEDKDNEDIITWLPDGQKFIIHDRKNLDKKILPKYFNKQTQYSSFTRKLARWGFSRLTKCHEAGVYSHPMFQRGQDKLLPKMKCTRDWRNTPSPSASAIHDNRTVSVSPSGPFGDISSYASPIVSAHQPSGTLPSQTSVRQSLAAELMFQQHSQKHEQQQQQLQQHQLEEAAVIDFIRQRSLVNQLMERQMQQQRNMLKLQSVLARSQDLQNFGGLHSHRLPSASQHLATASGLTNEDITNALRQRMLRNLAASEYAQLSHSPV